MTRYGGVAQRIPSWTLIGCARAFWRFSGLHREGTVEASRMTVVYRFGPFGYYGYSRTNVGHVWALEHCVATGILATMDYTFTTPD